MLCWNCHEHEANYYICAHCQQSYSFPQDVVKYIFTDYVSQTGKKFDGGDYDYGTWEFRDYWTGQLLHQGYWNSGSTTFPYCRQCGQFSKHDCSNVEELILEERTVEHIHYDTLLRYIS